MAILEIEGRLRDSPAFPGDGLDLELLSRSYINQGVITFGKIRELALERGRPDVARAIAQAFKRTERLDRWFQLGWIRQARARFQGLPWARRSTRWFRPVVWRLGRALNRIMP